MSNDIFTHCCYVKYNKSAKLKQKNFHGLNGNIKNLKTILWKRDISIIILTMCLCARILASNAELVGELDNS